MGVFLNIICTLLQYVFLFLLYYFLFRITRLMYLDLVGRKPKQVLNAVVVRLRIVESGGLLFTANEFSFEQEILIGRANDNDIVINDTYVSHQHAHIYKVNGQYILEDLASSNHTYINGKMLRKPVLLESGDLIKIGLVTLEFER